jgi:hypothetical protein
VDQVGRARAAARAAQAGVQAAQREKTVAPAKGVEIEPSAVPALLAVRHEPVPLTEIAERSDGHRPGQPQTGDRRHQPCSGSFSATVKGPLSPARRQPPPPRPRLAGGREHASAIHLLSGHRIVGTPRPQRSGGRRLRPPSRLGTLLDSTAAGQIQALGAADRRRHKHRRAPSRRTFLTHQMLLQPNYWQNNTCLARY